jgi:glycerophosphoryl diester phosphodiesterase
VRFALAFVIATSSVPLASAAISVCGRQMMICHRTANRDSPENTLEAIRESRILGCDAVEMDISRTLDGVLVLLHDGPIDRVSSGSGSIASGLPEKRSFEERAPERIAAAPPAPNLAPFCRFNGPSDSSCALNETHHQDRAGATVGHW